MKIKCTSLRQYLGSEVRLQPWPHSLRMDSKPPRCWPSCPVKRCLSCLGTELIPDILPIKKHKIPLPAALSSTCWKPTGPEAQRCAGLALQILCGGKEKTTYLLGINRNTRAEIQTSHTSTQQGKPGMVLPAGWKCYSITQTTQHQKTKRQNSLCSVWLMMPVSAMYVGRGNYCTHRHIWLVIFLLQQWKGEKCSKKTSSQHLGVRGSSTGFQWERHPQYLFFELAYLIWRIKSLQMQK